MISELTILYVEDDETVRENFTEILKQHFTNVITANNGRTALELYNEHKPNIALLDISIPYINGLNLASKIREKDSDIEIIILTAYSEKEKLIQAVNLQLFAYLIKPIQYEDFDKVINNILKKLHKNDYLFLTNDFKWNKNTKELFYCHTKIKLTNKEHAIVSLLCQYPHQYFSPYNIALEIAKEDNLEERKSNTMIQLLSRFKNKTLKELNIKHFFIENIYGAGYKLILK
jgi:DNA-binding response OmpR family regulator